MNKLDTLIRYLRNQKNGKYVSAKHLASILGVTDRTVRTYVKNINNEAPLLIKSSHEGYRINEVESPRLIESEYRSLMNRRFYILRQLFKAGETGIDLFDLAHTLYVSDATVRSDLALLSTMAKAYDLKITQKKEWYRLIGTEKNKRNLMIALIREQNTQGASFKEDIQFFLGKSMVKEVMAISRKTFKDNHFSPNTYFFQNFILHLALAIDRAKTGELLVNISDSTSELIKIYQNSTADRVIERICEELEKLFGIVLQIQDQVELKVLCYFEMKHDINVYDRYIDKEIKQRLEEVLEEVSTNYLLDFSEEQFRQKLMYHVQNLYNRAQDHRISRNFSLLDIKIKYPLLFDIAIFMTSLLSEKLKIEIHEDEISFLALHIGTFINNKTEEEKKIHAVIVTPLYLNMGDRIYSEVLGNFESELTIIAVYEEFPASVRMKEIDLVITTFEQKEIPDKWLKSKAVVKIKEFMTKSDLTKLREKMEQIYRDTYRQLLWEVVPKWIIEDFYLHTEHKLNKTLVFTEIMNRLQEKKYVDWQFKDGLEEREALSSTAFPSKIAIPHAIKYDAHQTGMLVIQSTKKIDWAGEEVALVIALAVKKTDSTVFNRIFPRMIEIVSEPFHVEYLARSCNREEFIKRLIELLTSEGYYCL